jgi:hypothetical protein
VLFETGDETSAPDTIGFDASSDFVPHHLAELTGSEPVRFGPDESHYLFDYEAVAAAYLGRAPVSWRRYPCVATGWDNSPRRQHREALILHGSSPEAYGRWLAEAATRQREEAGGDGIVFVNAWNEWAEGAHLEPDRHWGRAYLEKTRDVMRELFGFAPATTADELVHPAPEPSEELYHDLYERFVALQQASSGVLASMDRRMKETKAYYEAKLGLARQQGDLIADMNEWLTAQLQLQARRMNELALPEVASFDWLDDPPAVHTAARDCLGDHPSTPDDAPVRDGSPARGAAGSPLGADEQGLARLVGRDDHETDRLDNGFDDQPGRMPQWLVDVETSE